MKPLILFLILFLALAGMGTIWFIISRNKCVVPSKNDCPAGKAYYCPTPDGDATCDTFDKVCGDVPADFNDTNCNTTVCQYDTVSKTYKWACIGKGGTNSGDLTNMCTIATDGITLNHPTAIPNIEEGGYSIQDNNLIAASNASVYSMITTPAGKACALYACKSPNKVSLDQGICVPSDDHTTFTGFCTSTQYDGQDTHNQTDKNATYQTYYKKPAKYGDEPIKYCGFSQCSNPDLIVDDTNECVPTTGSIVGCSTQVKSNAHAASYGKDGGQCIILKCDYPFIVSSDKQSCVSVCPASSIYKYDADCNRIGCLLDNYAWNANATEYYDAKSCIPDCNNATVINSYLGTRSEPGFTFKANNFTNTGAANYDDKYVCIPTQSRTANPTDYFGGCGNALFPAYALNSDPTKSTATGCVTTINAQVAKYSNGLVDGKLDPKYTVGCLACAPRVCPDWATELSSCTSAIEQDCIYNVAAINNSQTSAVETCISDMSGRTNKSTTPLTRWAKFGNIDTNPTPAYQDYATYYTDAGIVPGNGYRNTFGAKVVAADNITLRFQELINSTQWVDIHIDNPNGPSTSDLPYLVDDNDFSSVGTAQDTQSLLIPNYSRTSDNITFWGWNNLAGSKDSARYLLTAKYFYDLLDSQPIPVSTLTPVLNIIVSANRSTADGLVGKHCDVYIVSIDALGNGDDGGNVYKSLQSYTFTWPPP